MAKQPEEVVKYLQGLNLVILRLPNWSFHSLNYFIHFYALQNSFHLLLIAIDDTGKMRNHDSSTL